MTKSVVIGNGESRRQLDLSVYQKDYTLIGCNAIHRDYTVDHLICCDRRMAAEAIENPNLSNTLIYVRPSWFHFFRKIKKNKNIRTVPELPYHGELKKDNPDHWGSGCYAVLLAAKLGFKEIELIGFDLYPIDHLVNNIYKDTKNYSSSSSPPVDPSYWIYQIAKVFDHYPEINFKIKNNTLWNFPIEWKKNNVSLIAI
jgi:hypothetical protein